MSHTFLVLIDNEYLGFEKIENMDCILFFEIEVIFKNECDA